MSFGKSFVLMGIASALLSGGVTTVDENIEACASEPVLTVFGEATHEVAPDFAKIYGVIEYISTEIPLAKDKVFESFDLIEKDLFDLGLDESNIISTYYYEGAYCLDGQIIVRNSLDFYVQTEDMENFVEMLTAISKVDYTTIKSITYELEDDEEYKEVLQEAKDNAMQKAEQLVNTEKLIVSEIKEEAYYINSSYKNFISVDDENLIKNIQVKAKVRVTMSEKTEEETSLNIQENSGEEEIVYTKEKE